jgi:hypothetical protein
LYGYFSLSAPTHRKRRQASLATATFRRGHRRNEKTGERLCIFRFMRGWLRPASGSFAVPGRDFLKDFACHALQLAEARQVVLEFVIERFRFFGSKLCSQNHVAQLDGMRQKRIFLQFFERKARVVVIHGSSAEKRAEPPHSLDAGWTPRIIVLAGRGRMRASRIFSEWKYETKAWNTQSVR